MNSGFAKFATSVGYNPFSDPTNLTWFEIPIQIDQPQAVITDIIMAAKTRFENGITYVYAIGHLGRLYKIQVNNTGTLTPNYNNPVLLTTLTINSPTFKYGASIQFYGATTKIYIGHDIGVTQVNFDGTGEAFIGSAGSYTANVPRASAQFNGVMYFGNGNNILSIDSTLTVTSYGVFPTNLGSGVYVRDVELSPDGNYLQIVVSNIPGPDLTAITQDTTGLTSIDSYLVLWNGTDINPTSRTTYNSHSLTTNRSFGNFSYTFGYDSTGTVVYESQHKILTLPKVYSPTFNAVYSSGNMVNFMNPESIFRPDHPTDPSMRGSLFAYGQYDEEYKVGLYRLLTYRVFLNILGFTGFTDSVQIPVCLQISNTFYGSSGLSSYTNNLVGYGQIYFSTVSTAVYNGNPIAGLFVFNINPTGTGTAFAGVYETQQETSIKLFHNIVEKKFKATAIRFYVSPLVTGNSFTIDIIGSDGNPIADSSYTFTVGGNCNVGDDVVKYSPTGKGTYSMGIRITNIGTVNWTGVKMEIDYIQFGE